MIEENCNKLCFQLFGLGLYQTKLILPTFEKDF